MLQNFFKTAWRNLVKSKWFSLINITGLGFGMAICLMILQYVNFELSYDQFNQNLDDLYRIYNDRYQNGKLIQHGTITYSGVGRAMQTDFPEVVNHTRMIPMGSAIISIDTKKFGEQQVLAVDNSFLSMFSYPFLAGDPATALKDPFTVVITRAAAARYFGENDALSAVGRVLMMNRDSTPYRISGVIRDVPENSHLQFDILSSYITIISGKNPYKEADYDFTDSDFWHYLQLRKGTDYHQLEARMDAFSQKYFQGAKVSGSVEKFHLQPLARAHLYSDFEYEIGKTGSATVVWGLLTIALFIIVIAWVNYINLSTARSADRAREVGVRKVSGASKAQLVRQFLTESLLINLVALAFALVLIVLLQPLFNSLVGHRLSLQYLFQKGLGGYSFSVGLLALMMVGIFISGFYPAFVLSSFRPILVLKGRFSGSRKGIILRKGLVIGQFAITVILIIGSIVVFRQIRYMNNQQLGLNIDQVMVIKPPMLSGFDSSFISRANSFKEELRHLANIKGAATSSRVAGDELSRIFDVHRSDDISGSHFTLRNFGVDFDYLGLYQLRLLAGRNFAPQDFSSEFNKLHNIILNEAAVRLLGFPSSREAIGRQVTFFKKNWDIIGVVNDFHQKSFRYPLEPTILQPYYDTYGPISVKIAARDLPATLPAIHNLYDQFFKGNLFDYYFLDEKFNAQYKDDLLFGRAFGIFAGLAIFIACLGLLGLSLFATQQRIKEIGIRKILGATIPNIVFLLSRDFIRLVLLAFLLASPVAYWLMHSWLRDFAYRIDIGWWVFALAGLLALAIALGTISFQAIRAAMANPARSLKTE